MKVNIKCKYCQKEFEDYKCNKRKFCSKECSAIGRENRGVTGEKWYKAMAHVDMGLHARGKKNPEHSKKMKGRTPWNKGKTNVQEKLYGIDNPSLRARLKRLNLSLDEYDNWKIEKKAYYRKVWRITNRQNLNLLENSDKERGLAGRNGVYHLDHIVSISYGFENKIDPNIIGDITNLQFIPWEDNLKKQ